MTIARGSHESEAPGRVAPPGDRRTRFLILGGGVTGLAFAARLQPSDSLICEANSEVGGYCRTVQRAGFTWDYSGHFFHFRRPEIEHELVSRIGEHRVRRVQRDSRVYYAGRLMDFPFQRHIHQLPQEEFLECLSDLVERPKEPPRNFREMLYARLGRGICEKFLVPYNEKLYATDLEALDVDAMGRFFPHASADDVIRGLKLRQTQSYNSTFTYPEGGAFEYVKALAHGIADDQVLLDERVTEIDLAKKVATTTRRRIAFEYLVSCAPFPQLLSLCGLPFDPGTYSHNKVLVFNLGFDRKGPRGIHWVYYPQRELSFYRVGFYDNIFDTERMSLYVELGYPAAAELSEQVIETARARVLGDLAACGVVDGHRLVAEHHVVLDPAYVHVTQASRADVERQRKLLAARGVYSAGRYGSWTYCSIEDNVIEARELADGFNELRAAGAL